MFDRRTIALIASLTLAMPAWAQVPLAEPDGGPGGASSTGGSSGGGMTADDEDAQGVEAGREGPTRPSPENRERGEEAVEVRPSTTPTETPPRQSDEVTGTIR
jgi:hypothetical protein